MDRNELYKISFGRVRAWMAYLVGGCLGSFTLPAWREFLGFLDSIYLDALDKELDERGHSYCRRLQHLREQSGGGGPDAGLDSGLD